MKIIDAHIHLFPQAPAISKMAERVGHENSQSHLRQVYSELNIVHSVVMGNRSIAPDYHDYEKDLFSYCVGLDSSIASDGLVDGTYELIEENLKREHCCGVKLYPGYTKFWLSDPMYDPIYKLAAKYEKPVAVHMGLTASHRSHLKYSHPMALDEVAADNHRTKFVMCHFGNPFFETAAAVLEKNHNVSADLSGLLDGPVDLDAYFIQRAGYIGLLQTWLAYINCWDRVMFGTDWPIVNIGDYIEYIRRVVPEQHHEAVFFDNANRIYKLGLS